MAIEELLFAGLRALRDYIATHVLTCLVPAFLLAGAMVAFIDREAIIAYLGERASKLRSFPIAAVASFFLAACSCTVIPVASGLFYSGAGIGVAFIVLWVAPATNVLALIYTGNILGINIVLARVVASLLMATIVGLVMSAVFVARKAPGVVREPEVKRGGIIARRELGLMLLILAALLLPNFLVQRGSYGWRVLVWAIATLAMVAYAWRALPKSRIAEWLRESWWFVRIIFPLLLLGVFIVGIIGHLLPEPWVRTWLGGNSVRASFLATMIGAISYFATMTEAPFVDTLMKSGMGEGPALTLLLTGPGISLPNWIAIARVFGIRKALVYVPTIIVLGTLTGWFLGNFIL